MFVADLCERADSLLADLGDLDADALLGTEAVGALETITRLERGLASARLALSRRVDETRAWSGRGHKDVADWLARQTGTTRGHARSQLETAGRLADQPTLAGALAVGEVSEAQASLIATATAANPDATDRLLESAGRRTMAGLREDCMAARAEREHEDDRWARQRRSRTARTWTDGDGMVNLRASFDPVAGSRVIAHLRAATDAVFREARREDRREPLDRYVADALEHLVTRSGGETAGGEATGGRATGGKATASTVTELVVVADLQALVRGEAHTGETVEVRGVGPVPVAVVHALSQTAFWKLAITHGVDVRTIAHLGRRVPAELRTALFLREPRCANPGCDNTARLDVDHTFVDYAADGPLSLDNAAPLCRGKGNCHDLKTRRGYRLEGVAGERIWRHPDGTIVAADPTVDIHGPPRPRPRTPTAPSGQDPPDIRPSAVRSRDPARHGRPEGRP